MGEIRKSKKQSEQRKTLRAEGLSAFFLDSSFCSFWQLCPPLTFPLLSNARTASLSQRELQKRADCQFDTSISHSLRFKRNFVMANMELVIENEGREEQL